jgi:hypothetical protein
MKVVLVTAVDDVVDASLVVIAEVWIAEARISRTLVRG